MAKRQTEGPIETTVILLYRYYNDILPEYLDEAGGAGVEVEGEGGSATSWEFWEEINKWTLPNISLITAFEWWLCWGSEKVKKCHHGILEGSK